jgi:hypothetical protein
MSDEQRTPRDWLLQRHHNATPQLDALRHSVLPLGTAPAPTRIARLAALLHEIFRPHRHAWAVLTLVWILLTVVHFAARSPVGTQPTQLAPTAEEIAQWVHQLRSYENFVQMDQHR